MNLSRLKFSMPRPLGQVKKIQIKQGFSPFNLIKDSLHKKSGWILRTKIQTAFDTPMKQ